MVSGVIPPSSGTVRLFGAPAAHLPPRRIAALGLARTFQHVRLLPNRSVLENIALGAHLSGRAGMLRAMLRLDRAEEARLLAEARAQAGRVGLGGVLDMPAGDLPLGQQRVVEIARALCLRPRLLLLDEPAPACAWRTSSVLPTCCASCVPRAWACCWSSTTWTSSCSLPTASW